MKKTTEQTIEVPSHQQISKRSNGSTRIQFMNMEPSKTQQQFKEESDVNNIIKKYQQTGQVTHLARNPGIYADVSGITDYQESMEKVTRAREAFDALPARIRDRFQNNPQAMLEHLQNPEKLEENIKLGLFKKMDQPSPTTAPKQQNDLNEQTKKQEQAKPSPEPT